MQDEIDLFNAQRALDEIARVQQTLGGYTANFERDEARVATRTAAEQAFAEQLFRGDFSGLPDEEVLRYLQALVADEDELVTDYIPATAFAQQFGL